jgi:hypothetical protein
MLMLIRTTISVLIRKRGTLYNDETDVLFVFTIAFKSLLGNVGGDP